MFVYYKSGKLMGRPVFGELKHEQSQEEAGESILSPVSE